MSSSGLIHCEPICITLASPPPAQTPGGREPRFLSDVLSEKAVTAFCRGKQARLMDRPCFDSLSRYLVISLSRYPPRGSVPHRKQTAATTNGRKRTARITPTDERHAKNGTVLLWRDGRCFPISMNGAGEQCGYDFICGNLLHSNDSATRDRRR